MDAEKVNAGLPLARPPAAPPRRETLSLADGYATSLYVHDPPAGSKRPSVVYLHGIQSHPGWFVGSAAALAQKGYLVVQPSRRGSGDNSLDRGDARSAGQLLGDVDCACQFAARGGAGGVHLIGVSWGGKLAACYAADPGRCRRLASLTMIAPGVVPRVGLTPARRLAVALALLTCSKRRFEIPLNNVELFTGNHQMRDYLNCDRFRLHDATGRFLYASWCLDRLLGRVPAGRLSLPVTLILASQDRIINNAATRKAVSRLAGKGLVVKELPGAHTLEFEPDPQPLYDALAEALERGV